MVGVIGVIVFLTEILKFILDLQDPGNSRSGSMVNSIGLTLINTFNIYGAADDHQIVFLLSSEIFFLIIHILNQLNAIPCCVFHTALT